MYIDSDTDDDMDQEINLILDSKDSLTENYNNIIPQHEELDIKEVYFDKSISADDEEFVVGLLNSVLK